MTQGLNLVPVARALLNAVVAHFDGAGVTLPERRVIAPGNPDLVALDCPSVTVTLAGIGWGTAPDVGAGSRPRGLPISTAGMRHAVFAVRVAYTIPDTDAGPPPAVEVTEVGEQLLRDAGLLSQAIADFAAIGVPEYHGKARPGLVAVGGPEGGYATLQTTLEITIGSVA